MDLILRNFGLELGLFFLVGALAEIHCLGMCGPLIAAYSRPDSTGGTDRISWTNLRRHFSYHGFRIGTYALLGSLLGLLGQTLVSLNEITETLRVVRGGIGVVIGGIIGLYGLSYLLKARTSTLLDDYFGKLGSQLFGFAQQFLRSKDQRETLPSSRRGSLHAILPCPILYPAYLYVLARGSMLFGFTAMLVLGIGTTPLLFAYGVFMEDRASQFPPFVHRLLGGTFIVLSYVTFSMGLRNLGVDVPVIALPFYQPL